MFCVCPFFLGGGAVKFGSKGKPQLCLLEICTAKDSNKIVIESERIDYNFHLIEKHNTPDKKVVLLGHKYKKLKL